MRFKRLVFVLSSTLILLTSACSEHVSEVFPGAASPSAPMASVKQKPGNQYLAYEHRISLQIPSGGVENAFEQTLAFCIEDSQFECAVLGTNLNSGDRSSAYLKVRILPEGVKALIDQAAQSGSLSNKSTDVEDLQDSIVDNSQRLENYKTYQARLREIEAKPDIDIESLIKVAKELAEVQTNIEYLAGEKAKLLERTRKDVVHLSFNTEENDSFWDPVSRSLSEFGDNLADGLSWTLTAVAYLVPAGLILVPLLWLMRLFWRWVSRLVKSRRV